MKIRKKKKNKRGSESTVEALWKHCFSSCLDDIRAPTSLFLNSCANILLFFISRYITHHKWYMSLKFSVA